MRLGHFPLGDESEYSDANAEQEQRTRFRRAHGHGGYIDLMLAIGYIPEKTIGQEAGTVGELPNQRVVVHDAECLAERIERTVDKVYLKERFGIEQDISTHV